MKKIFLTLICSLISVVAFCQTTEHLKFMGIPINGTPNAFGQKLVAKGFRRNYDEDRPEYNAYDGKFACCGESSASKCIIHVLKYKNTVYAICVTIIPYGDEYLWDGIKPADLNLSNSWDGIKPAYINIRNNIYNKYDCISVDDDEYGTECYYESDLDKLRAIRLNDLRVSTIFHIDENGSKIKTEIGNAFSIKLFDLWCINILYVDGINFKKTISIIAANK